MIHAPIRSVRIEYTPKEYEHYNPYSAATYSYGLTMSVKREFAHCLFADKIKESTA